MRRAKGRKYAENFEEKVQKKRNERGVRQRGDEKKIQLFVIISISFPFQQ